MGPVPTVDFSIFWGQSPDRNKKFHRFPGAERPGSKRIILFVAKVVGKVVAHGTVSPLMKPKSTQSGPKQLPHSAENEASQSESYKYQTERPIHFLLLRTNSSSSRHCRRIELSASWFLSSSNLRRVTASPEPTRRLGRQLALEIPAISW